MMLCLYAALPLLLYLFIPSYLEKATGLAEEIHTAINRWMLGIKCVQIAMLVCLAIEVFLQSFFYSSMLVFYVTFFVCIVVNFILHFIVTEYVRQRYLSGIGLLLIKPEYFLYEFRWLVFGTTFIQLGSMLLFKNMNYLE